MRRALDDAALTALLDEDAPYGDLTTRSLGIASHAGRMVFSSRAALTLCGSEEAARLVELAGGTVERCVPSGTQLPVEGELLVATGSAASLHRAWKTAQTLVEYLSGIASCAADMVASLRDAGYGIPLACTRKNFPGTRHLAAKAVGAGGAIMHRLGLSETLLVFPEHRVFFDASSLASQFALLKRNNPEKKLVVEVANQDEALQCARAGADILQLERFPPEALTRCKKALAAASLYPLVAPAGGVTLANLHDYAAAGADFLVSSAPYFAAPKDIRVTLTSF